jgi:hypothetical protein
MRRGMALAAGLIAAVTGAAGCSQLKSAQPASPTEGSPILSVGWTSASESTTLEPGECGNVDGQITSRTLFSATGKLTARCYGDVTLDGTAQGTAFGTTIKFSSAGIATGPDRSTCPYTVSGNAVPEGADRMRVTYSGSSCFGPIGGSALAKKK